MYGLMRLNIISWSKNKQSKDSMSIRHITLLCCYYILYAKRKQYLSMITKMPVNNIF